MSSAGFSVAPMSTLRPCRDVNTAFWANRPPSATTCIHIKILCGECWIRPACVCVRKKECRSTANKPNDQCVCPTRTNFNVQGWCSWFPVCDDLLLLFRRIKVNTAPASAVVSSVSCWLEAARLFSGYSSRFGLDEP